MFVCEKWCGSNPDWGEPNAAHSFWGPLEASGLGTHELFHFDEYYLNNSRPGDLALLQRCIELRPDCIFLIWSWSESTHLNPLLETLHTLRTRLNIPVINWWGDVDSYTSIMMANLISPYSDAVLVGDSASAHLEMVECPYKFRFMPHPKDPRIFFDPGTARDIPVSFTGGIEGREIRRDLIAALREAGIPVTQAGGQREQNLKISEYAQVLQRSKISFNETRPKMVNGKIIEIPLCGALLMDKVGSGIESVLQPNSDFIPYIDAQDLITKAKYFLEHDSERIAIAQRGRDKMQKIASAEEFWRKILHLVAQSETFKFHEAHLALAKRYYNLGKFSESAGLLFESIAISPNNSQAHYLLAQIHYRNGQVNESIDNLMSAITADPKNTAACLDLAKELRLQSRADEAVEVLKANLELNPSNRTLNLELAACLLEAGDPNSAREIYDKLILNDPADSAPQIGLANMCLTLGIPKGAEQLAFQVQAMEQIGQEAHFELAKIFEKLGYPYEAAKHRWQAASPEAPRSFWDVYPNLVKYEYTGELELQAELLKNQCCYATESHLQAKYAAFKKQGQVH